MLNLKKIAVTGGLASGKSTTCRIFEELGAYVVSADTIVHHLLSPDSVIGQQVIQLLGSEILNNQQFDRRKIAEKVFSHPERLKALENIIHPAVFAEMDKHYNRIKNADKYSLFVAEIPLLYEVGAEENYDAVIAVIADPKICRERFIDQKGCLDQEFTLRMQAQMPPETKATKASYVITNNGTMDALKRQVMKIYSSLTST